MAFSPIFHDCHQKIQFLFWLVSKCLSSKNRLKCFVTVIKSNQHFNCQTFPFLAGTKLHVHGVYCASPIKTTEAFEYSYDDVEIKSHPKGA